MNKFHVQGHDGDPTKAGKTVYYSHPRRDIIMPLEDPPEEAVNQNQPHDDD